MKIALANSDGSIRNIKFILVCYEAMSGMKINYEKSGVYVLGIEEIEKNRIAELLNCKVGELPITYLGLPVSDCKLSKAQFIYHQGENPFQFNLVYPAYLYMQMGVYCVQAL